MAPLFVMAERWWTLAFRGLAAILFGILTFIAPGASLLALVLLFGAFALVNGLAALSLAFTRRRSGEPRWGSLVVEGSASVLAGLVTVLWPRITALALLWVIAVWALVTGGAEILAAARLRRVIRGEWMLGVSGALSVAFGVLLLASPGAGALAVAIWIGAYAILFGALLLALSLRLRAWGRTPSRHVPTGGLPAEPAEA